MYEATIQIRNKKGKVTKELKRQVPESWNELSCQQLLRIIGSVLRIQERSFFQLSVAGTLLQLPEKLLVHIPSDQILAVFLKADFIEAETKALTAQLLPWIQPGKFTRRYYGPRERLRNMSFLEFIFADTYFIHYTQSQDEQLLNKFIACLYRERTWFHFIRRRLASYNGDIRQPFNENLLDERARALAHLPEEVKFAILTWYRGCRNYLEQDYPHVFSSENQEQAAKSGWDSVLRSMSQGVHTIDATGRVLISNVLGVMEDRAVEIKEHERKNQLSNEK